MAGAPACPCGGLPPGASFAQCCGRWQAGPLQGRAPDALHLMRSRYSAYVREDEAYLLATWHARKRPATVAFEPGLRWLGLEIRHHSSPAPDQAVVEFVARCRGSSGRAHRLHERSRFVREDGRWTYVDGDQL